jgi:hypothetical protein
MIYYSLFRMMMVSMTSGVGREYCLVVDVDGHFISDVEVVDVVDRCCGGVVLQ